MHLAKDHPYRGAGRGTLERSRARNPLVRPGPRHCSGMFQKLLVLGCWDSL
ncbi:hypothetical protein V6Z11_A08G238300 [Gossypium hirsutum]